MKKKTKAQILYSWLDDVNRNKDEAREIYERRLKRFGKYMYILAFNGRLFEKDYKGNLRCVNADSVCKDTIKEENNE